MHDTKIILTIESGDPAFINRIVGALRNEERPAHLNVNLPVPQPVQQILAESPAGAANAETVVQPSQAAPAVGGETKKPRKPRSDAGQPRGSYGKKDTDNAALAETLRAQQAAQSAAAATQQPQGSSPEETKAPSVTAQGARVAPAAAAAPSGKLTIADARAALDRINVTPGLGMPACIAHINSFGYARISDVPAEKYAEFIAQADAKIAAAGKK